MDIVVNLTPEQIDKCVTDAIVKSAIGKRIEEAVTKALQGYEMNRAIDDEIKNTVRIMVQELLRKDENIIAKIKACVVEKLTPDFLDKVVDAAIDKMHNY